MSRSSFSGVGQMIRMKLMMKTTTAMTRMNTTKTTTAKMPAIKFVGCRFLVGAKD